MLLTDVIDTGNFGIYFGGCDGCFGGTSGVVVGGVVVVLVVVVPIIKGA